MAWPIIKLLTKATAPTVPPTVLVTVPVTVVTMVTVLRTTALTFSVRTVMAKPGYNPIAQMVTVCTTVTVT